MEKKIQPDAVSFLKRTQREIMQTWAESASPLVSINAIAYNHVHFIRQALDGFLMQETNFPFEILIHDDASSDGTADIIREYAEQYPYIIKPVYQTENQYSKRVGISLTFNFPRVRGKYLAMCEGDDYWTDPLKLQKQVDYLEANPDCSVCFHPVKVIYEDGSVEETVYPEKNEFPLNTGRTDFNAFDLLRRNFIQTNSVVYRWVGVDKIPDFFQKHTAGDFQLHFLHAVNGKIGYIDEIMGVYRKHSGGIYWHVDEKEHVLKIGEDWIDMLITMRNYYSNIYTDDFNS